MDSDEADCKPSAVRSQPLLELLAPPSLLDQRVLLGQKVKDGVPPPEFLASPSLGDGLFYRDHLFIISGHKKAGKTLLVERLAVDTLEAGRACVYVDLENGEDIISERLALMGADPDTLDELFYYLPFPTGITLATFRAQLEDVADRLPGVFIVVDSLRGLFTRLSGSAKKPLSLNDASDIEQVLGPINDVVKTRKVTAGVIDHAKKGGSKDDEYSTSNSVGKEQIADVTYFFTKVDPYGEDLRGAVSLTVTSDRRGKLPATALFWAVGGQGANKPICFTPTDGRKVGTQGEVRDAVRQYLIDNAGGSFTQTQLEENVTGKAAAVRSAAKELASDADEPVYRVPGDRKGTEVYVYDAARIEPNI